MYLYTGVEGAATAPSGGEKRQQFCSPLKWSATSESDFLECVSICKVFLQSVFYLETRGFYCKQFQFDDPPSLGFESKLWTLSAFKLRGIGQMVSAYPMV